MKNQDAEVVLRVLVALRKHLQPVVHLPADLPQVALVDEAVRLVKAEIAANARRGDAKRRG